LEGVEEPRGRLALAVPGRRGATQVPPFGGPDLHPVLCLNLLEAKVVRQGQPALPMALALPAKPVAEPELEGLAAQVEGEELRDRFVALVDR